MSVAVFCERLGAYTPHRAQANYAAGTTRVIYAYVGPDNPASQANLTALQQFRTIYRGPMYGWFANTADQARDVAAITAIQKRYPMDGWTLDIEKPLEAAPLRTLVAGVAALGKPIVASLAAWSPAHAEYDYETLQSVNAVCDWQSYFDSGEGCTPPVAVRGLARTPFVLPGWKYRAENMKAATSWVTIQSFVRIGNGRDGYVVTTNGLTVSARERVGGWGYEITDRAMRDRHGTQVGRLLGRCAYNRISVTLDTTRGAARKHTLDEWTRIAASAKIPGAAKRPITVYLAEVTPDDVLQAIAKGAP